MFILVFVLLLFNESLGTNDFDRLATLPVNYRYFAEVGQSYKILGSCNELKMTVSMSRCILQIVHQYKPKLFSINFAEEVIGTGTVISKSINDDQPYIIILTAFHIVVPQFDLSLSIFIIISFSLMCILIIPILIYYSSVVYQYLCRICFSLVLYIIIGSCLVYYVISIIYPFFFNSSFRVMLSLDNNMDKRSKALQVSCELISSKFVISYPWYDDIGKLSNFFNSF
jgi:hypothetical protein